MHRLGIFRYSGGRSEVSPHVLRALAAFGAVCDKIVFATGADLGAESAARVGAHAQVVIVQDDVWAERAALEHVSFAGLGTFDEIVFFSDAVIAPVGDPEALGAMFDAMAQRAELDGWTLTERSDGAVSVLQCLLMCTRPALHGTVDFREYWDQMPALGTAREAQDYHEARFSRHFRALGYRLEPFIEAAAGGDDAPGGALLRDVAGLLAAGAPILSDHAFTAAPELIERWGGQGAADNLAALARETSYPTAEVWAHMIAELPVDDLIAVAELCRTVGSPGASATDFTRQGPLVLATLEDVDTRDLSFARLARFPAERVVVATDCETLGAAAQAAGYATVSPGPGRMALHGAAARIATEDGVILHLSDFAQEPNRPGFKARLFETFWDPLLDAQSAQWLAESPHLGLAFVPPGAVTGVQSHRTGTRAGLGNWASGFRPDCLLRAADQAYWPWRGNVAIKAALVRDPRFQAGLEVLLDNLVVRPRESLAGPEGALPELAREAGFASGLLVPHALAHKLLLRAATEIRKSNRRVGDMAQRMRTEVSKTRRALDRSAEGVPLAPPIRPTADGPFTQIIAPQPAHFALVRGSETVLLEQGLALEVHVEHWEITGGHLFAQGWAFDLQATHHFLHVGLAVGTHILLPPAPLNEARPDVLKIYYEFSPNDICGFDIVVPVGETTDAHDIRLVFINPETARMCLVALPTQDVTEAEADADATRIQAE